MAKIAFLTLFSALLSACGGGSNDGSIDCYTDSYVDEYGNGYSYTSCSLPEPSKKDLPKAMTVSGPNYVPKADPNVPVPQPTVR